MLLVSGKHSVTIIWVLTKRKRMPSPLDQVILMAQRNIKDRDIYKIVQIEYVSLVIGRDRNVVDLCNVIYRPCSDLSAHKIVLTCIS